MSPIEEIKNRLDIVNVIGSYIKLQKAGTNYRAVCPFHSEKSPSFFVSPSKQIWHCFGSCSEGGDIFKFVMKIEGVEFKDALKILADKAGVELKKEDIKITTKRQKTYDIYEIACSFFEKQLESKEGEEIKKYLTKRGVNLKTIKKWRIGYSPDLWDSLLNFLISKGYKKEDIEEAGIALKSEKGKFYDRFRGRIIFPIFDINSRVVAFGGRIFKDSEKEKGAKYLNSPTTLIYDKSEVLYGLNNSSLGIRKNNSCIIVEGYMDAIMVFQSGCKNVVATSGTALTNRQLNLIKRYTENIYMAFDMDNAGNSATKRGIELSQLLGFNIKIITMKEGSDPADIVKENPKEWEKMIKNAKTIHDFYFDTTLLKFDKNTIEGKKKISKELIPVIKNIPNKIEQSLWIKDLAEILQVKEDTVFEELSKIKDNSYDKIEEEEVKEEKKEKTKKDILEEYLICLLMKEKDLSNFIEKDDFDFFCPEIREIIQIIKRDPEEIKKIENNRMSAIIMKSELYEIDGDLEGEVQRCVKDIKKDCYKKELQEMTFKIKKGEDNKREDEIEKFKNEFNQILKKLNEL